MLDAIHTTAATIINIDLPWNPAVLEQRIGRIYRLGQQNNIQVINLVAPDSIEEDMVGKLRFKTSMFEGVLDGGEDSVFVEKNKFAKMMEAVSDMMDEKEEDDKATGNQEADATISLEDEEEKKEIATQKETQETKEQEKTIELRQEENLQEPKDDFENEISSAELSSPTSASGHHESFESSANTTKARKPQDLVSQGVSFLSGLAETLKSPEATQHLVDSIVEKDETTGETAIKIPVDSKETVSNLLGLIGKLFAK